jgi:hypothetical protein
MTPRHWAGLLAAPLLLAAACSDSSAEPGPTPSPDAAVSIEYSAAELAERAGCTRAVDTPDRPLFMQQAVDCLDPAWTTGADHVAFYVFGNNEGRDAWLHLAQTFGDVGVIKGDRWAVEIPDNLPGLDPVATTIRAKLDGERVS